jgi:tetratricopeptide (TPR) repeat protein
MGVSAIPASPESVKIRFMRSWYFIFVLAVSIASWAQQSGQQTTPPASLPDQGNSQGHKNADQKSAAQTNAPDLEPPRSDRVRADDLGSSAGESSSKDTETDLAPPEDDAKAHPQSSSKVAEAEAGISPGGISEFHTWNPHQAAKSIEVGDFYFKRRNYKAAEERYREALGYKDNDAVATFKLALSLEKLGVYDDARSEYESYLKILPYGPEAGQVKKALERLKSEAAKAQ